MLTLLALACTQEDSGQTADADADGVSSDLDCDDLDAGIGEEVTVYADADEDGYGTGEAIVTCDPGGATAAEAGDCADDDAAINPAAEDGCDGIDNNCDGATDEAATFVTVYTDTDGDGFGDDLTGVTTCDPDDDAVTDGGDCDDTDPDYNPGASESCSEPEDYNCDGTVAYLDVDGDGYPSSADCASAEDCDDANPDVHSRAREVCDDIDNNCDGEIDVGVIDASKFYLDKDADGYGDPNNAVYGCEPEPTKEGYESVEDGTDCDDTTSAIHPGAEESDCTDPIDYNCDGSVAYADADADGFPACEDCDDTNKSANADGIEACNGDDDDCDGEIDEAGATGELTWYADDDGDGYGADGTLAACELPAGYAATADDCDDEATSIHPDAAESCNDTDDDCDGDIDESAGDAAAWYADADGDGYGDPDVVTETCDQPADTSDDATDCDDADDAVNPGMEESCNTIDDDCDGETDEDSAGDAGSWYTDGDADGHGSGDAMLSCEQPSGTSATDGDCDDSDDTVGLATTWYADGDADGYGATATAACEMPADHSAEGGDCDDADDAVNPDATEACNGLDDDCDGETDGPGASGETTWYADADADGYGSTETVACDMPADHSATGGDCDEGDDAVNPGATELCNGADDDCDGYDDDGALGASTDCPAADCAEILASDPDAASGTYALDAGAFYCEMDLYDGGWTRVADDAAVYGTGYTGTYYNTEGFTWSEALFANATGSTHGHCTFPDNMTGCNPVGMQFGSESWGLALNWGSSICGMSTTDYTAATTYVGGTDWTIARSSSTSSIRVGMLEGISSCTTSDNYGTAYLDIFVR